MGKFSDQHASKFQHVHQNIGHMPGNIRPHAPNFQALCPLLCPAHAMCLEISGTCLFGACDMLITSFLTVYM